MIGCGISILFGASQSGMGVIRGSRQRWKYLAPSPPDSGYGAGRGNISPRFLSSRRLQAFLYRTLLTAQWLADSGETELGSELLDRLQQILALFPEAMFSELRLQCAATREAIQPIRQERDFVPYLSPDYVRGTGQRNMVPP